MKPNLGRYKDGDTNDLSIKLTNILSNVNLDNVKYQTIEGVTDATANTSRIFKHGLNPRPWVVLFQSQDGGCYVQNISNTVVDIRSTRTSANFVALALG